MHRVWERMDICLSMAESLCCSQETITTSLIGYTPIQKKQFLKKMHRDHDPVKGMALLSH